MASAALRLRSLGVGRRSGTTAAGLFRRSRHSDAASAREQRRRKEREALKDFVETKMSSSSGDANSSLYHWTQAIGITIISFGWYKMGQRSVQSAYEAPKGEGSEEPPKLQDHVNTTTTA